MIRPAGGLPLALLAALLAFGVGAPAADAVKTFTVDPEISDTSTANTCEKPCSLRQAINDANVFTHEKKEEVVVDVPPATYILSEGALLVEPGKETKENIEGLASRANEVVIEPGPGRASQVMSVGSANGAGQATLSLLEITGGSTSEGGGIHLFTKSTLSLVYVAVVNNSSEGEGGGIAARGTLNVIDSLVAHNKTTQQSGGGVANLAENRAHVTIVNSTITGNEAAMAGGGIENGAAGLKLESDTITANNAGTEGGAVAGETFETANSIFAQNKPTSCSSKATATGGLGHNIFGEGSCKGTAAGDKETNPELVEEALGGLPLLADNEGPTETIALQSTSPAIGAGSGCPASDQRGVARPAKSCDIGAFQLSKETTPPSARSPGPPPGSGPPPPAPTAVLGKTGDVQPVSGTVLVKLPGTKTFVALTSLQEVPFGTVVDAIHGKVLVTTAGPHGGTQKGEFFDGEFVLTQSHSGLVQAALTGGNFSICPTRRERSHIAGATARSAGKRPVRKLWANAHGSFSTKGDYAAGAVEGTEWLTEDFCDGTEIRVARDKVLVTNLVNHRRFTIKAGHHYFAKAP
jgi:hypothetical protein